MTTGASPAHAAADSDEMGTGPPLIAATTISPRRSRDQLRLPKCSTHAALGFVEVRYVGEVL